MEDIQKILEILPHRYPLLLIDRVLDYKLGEYIIGIKNVTFNEPHFTGHFPDKPIMPGVLIVEAMAQLSALFVAKALDTVYSKDVLFLSIENAKFRKPVTPGDTLKITSTLMQNRLNVWKFLAIGRIDDQIAAEATFTAMVQDKVRK